MIKKNPIFEMEFFFTMEFIVAEQELLSVVQ